MDTGLEFILNSNAKELHINDLSLVQRFVEDATPANRTARHKAINTTEEITLFLIRYLKLKGILNSN